MTPTNLLEKAQHNEHITRRNALRTLGVGIIGTGAFSGLYLGTQVETSSALTISGLNIDDTDRKLAPSESVTSAGLNVTGSYEYSSSHPLDRTITELQVGVNGSELETLDTSEVSDPAQSVESESYSLNGDLLSHGQLSEANFNPSDTGQQLSTELLVRVILLMLKGGEEVGLADSETTVMVSVVKEEITVSASIVGNGDVSLGTG